MSKSGDPAQQIMDGPQKRYAALLADGSLQPDPAQAAVIERLQDLHERLSAPSPAPAKGGFLARLGFGRKPAAEQPGNAAGTKKRGLYLHGPVGRGKSMLMDLFFDAATLEPKRRVHFHAFMQDVHQRLNDLRQRDGRARDDVIGTLAGEIASDVKLLCFDEFHVQNIADAMILGRLFEQLFEAGIVTLATSNFPPDKLYEGGLNRDRFLPFIERLKTQLEIIAVAGPTDYRLERLQDVPVYYCPLGPAADEALRTIFARLTDDAPGGVDEIDIGSRRLIVPRAARGVAWFDFKALCEQPLGARDYLALTEHYHTLIVQGVPELTRDKHNEARRFMTLVDALYECRVNLIVSAEAEPQKLYRIGDGAFEFERTASRLMEMQSKSYIETPPSTIAAADFIPFALTTDLI